MNQTDLRMLALLPLLAGLCCAAWIDLRQRRIPNWLTAAILVAGVAQSWLPAHLTTPGRALTGFATGLGIGLVMFVFKAFTGGDVKLLAAVGSWVGPWGVMLIIAAAALVGLVWVLVQCAYHRRLTVLFRNSAVLSMNLINVRHVGVDGVIEQRMSADVIDRPLPYAVPVMIGVLVAAWW